MKQCIVAATSKPSTPSFRGNSWLMVQPKRIPIKEKRNGPVLYNSRVKNDFKVSLNFSTISLDGLLLWIHSSKNRFLGLGIQNGQMKFASNLLDGTGNVFEMPNGGFVSDGGNETKTIGAEFVVILPSPYHIFLLPFLHTKNPKKSQPFMSRILHRIL